MNSKNALKARSAAAVLVLTLGISGCGNARSSGTTLPADSSAESVASTGKSVGLSFPTEDTERWKAEGKWLADRFTARGYEAKLVYSSGSADQQAKDLASLVNDGVSLLIVAPTDSSKISDALASAKEAGIPVLSYGSAITDSDAVSCAVLPDYRQMGALQAEAVISGLGVSKDAGQAAKNIELAAGSADDPSTPLLYDGIYSTLEPYLESGSLKVLSGKMRLADVETKGNDVSGSESRMEEILKSSYSGDTTLSAVIGGTDAAAQGIVKAVERSGQKKSNVIITGSGTDGTAKDLITSGKQEMTAYVDTSDEAVAAVDIGISLMTEEATDSYVVSSSGWDFSCTYNTTDISGEGGVIPSFLIEPVIVTKKNADKVFS